ncbi:tegument serine/threonine protein kinase [Aotine betaherpesvirus 1]|uniref:Tegument serine/threonine protein kinase n=1 Tax=Aotine betaherpesvirus 1 TaxID=50290 RepID=G8XUG2_9BETA|nr:tegument serine/threonine protein kinase [Aotine betaherpesvirus 1]AEV80792.1 tegument serine/threonine protein kinase [Aotine betaherpesvirus 1]
MSSSDDEMPQSPAVPSGAQGESVPLCPAAPKKKNARKRRRLAKGVRSSVKRALRFTSGATQSTPADVDMNRVTGSGRSPESSSPTESFLRCYERLEDSVPLSEDSNCPICCRRERGLRSSSSMTRALLTAVDESDDGEREDDEDSSPGGCGHTYSNEHHIVTPLRNLRCDPTLFYGLHGPREHSTTLNSPYVLVYAPKAADFCDTVCRAVDLGDEDHRLGQGSFGEIWPLDESRVIKIAKKHSETILTVWLSGVARYRAGGPEREDGVYRSLLTATGACLLHNVTVLSRFQTDMYHHDVWTLEAIPSYRAAFHSLADAVRFLNHDCDVSHLDITPMNVLIDVSPQKPGEIVRVALCDYSLCEMHPTCGRRGAVVFQETQTARPLPACMHRLRECYHPAFRPVPLQKLVTLNPHARFPVGSPQRFCAAEMVALANVLLFCLARVLDRRGLEAVRRGPEHMLFQHAAVACRALDAGDVTACSGACLMILAAQLSYLSYLLGDVAAPTICRLHRFVESRFDDQQVAAFQKYCQECSRVMDYGSIRKNLDKLLNTAHGLYLYDVVRRAARFTSIDDLDCDCRTIFPE